MTAWLEFSSFSNLLTGQRLHLSISQDKEHPFNGWRAEISGYNPLSTHITALWNVFCISHPLMLRMLYFVDTPNERF